jgi:serine protease DegS
MTLRKLILFLLQAVTIGLAAAFLYVLLVQPRLLQREASIVEVREAAPLATAPAPVASSGEPDWRGPVSYADAVATAAPAIVNIHTAKVITRRSHPLLEDPVFRHFFGDRLGKPRHEVQTSLGSGVIISPHGFVLTNNHVIDGADEIQVLLSDGRSARAMVAGVDPDTDLAVLRVALEELPSVVIGDSRNLRVGDVALAIGNPFGVGQTVTLGIISATGRDHLGINTYEDFIQTDAAINPGNSGGALINARGELIGINSAIYSRSGGSQGIGFAIPVNLAKNVMKQIIERGHVVRGWLGIEAQDLTPQLAETFGVKGAEGVLIAGVLRDGPADNAGILPGDIVTSIDGTTVKDARQAMNIISDKSPNTVIRIGGVRKGQPYITRATVIQRPSAARRDD